MSSPLIASFDVFDTLISRIYAAPEDVYGHVADVLAELGLISAPSIFVEARYQAEVQAWARRGRGRGAAIDEIYQILAPYFKWDDQQTQQAMDQEIRLEGEAARVVPDMARLLQDARRRGVRVCFISDMHLRSANLREMLAKFDLFKHGDALFVSSDAGALKSSGTLFEHVVRTLQVEARDIHHVGDNEASDYRNARRKRLRATLYTRTHLNRFESAALQALGQANWRERTIATVSKFTRLSRHCDASDRDLWEIISSTIAPFVAGYALWLIEQAERRGIEKLFFLARDMQIVQQVASRFAREKGIPLQCINMYASRNVWLPAGYSGASDFDLFWLTDALGERTPDRILKRLTGDDRLSGTTARFGPLPTSTGGWDRQQIRELLESKHVKASIQQATRARRHVLLAYLKQCGYAPTTSCAIVDAGWRGTLQNSLARAFSLEGMDAEILGFYVGLRHVGYKEPTSVMIPFLPDAVVNEHGLSLVSLIESFLLADHGTLIGFRNRQGIVEPILGPRPDSAMLRQWALVRESCLVYAQQLIGSPVWKIRGSMVPSALTAPLLKLCRDPTPSEAKSLGQWFFDSGREEPALRRLASRITIKDIAKLMLARLRSQLLADTYLSCPWTRGSVAASPTLVRYLANLLIRN